MVDMTVTNSTSVANNQPPPGVIILLSAIRQTCQLVPDFKDDTAFHHTDVLDKCTYFFLNSFSSKYTYQSIW